MIRRLDFVQSLGFVSGEDLPVRIIPDSSRGTFIECYTLVSADFLCLLKTFENKALLRNYPLVMTKITNIANWKIAY